MALSIVMSVEELQCIQEQSYEAGRGQGFSIEEVEALREEWIGRIAEDQGRQTVIERRLQAALAQVRALEEALEGMLGSAAPPRMPTTAAATRAVGTPPGGTPLPRSTVPRPMRAAAAVAAIRT